jgi:glycine/D-amino acid oxidase-like deaminating enzyme
MTASTPAGPEPSRAGPGSWPAKALADAEPVCFWLDSALAPEPSPPHEGRTECDLAVVGGGFTGLWTALLAKERDPSSEVVLLEAGRFGWQASGRNGGFCMSTLTHGIEHGMRHFPGELDTLQRLGLENLDAIESFVADHAIECDWRRSGEMGVATEPYQVVEIGRRKRALDEHGDDAEYFDREAIQTEVHSPRFLAAVWEKRACAMVDPARLAWGVARVCREAGVRMHENTRVLGLSRGESTISLSTLGGTVHARKVALATNAFRSFARQARRRVVPVYDHALMTEPLSPERWESVGWRRRQGLGDVANQFHYYRVTEDGRILWGGYDALYHYGSAIDPCLEERQRTDEMLSRHFFEWFPQLEGVRFTHRWAGVVDVCTRLCLFFGTAMGGCVAYALGYTGNGVGESRFGANVMLDLLSGEPTELTRLKLVRTQPMAWPHEPLRWAAIELTRRSLDWADKHEGRRNLWLRTLDRFGLGYDS